MDARAIRVRTEVHVKLVMSLTAVNARQTTTEGTVKVSSLLHISICMEGSHEFKHNM